jgi:hypothetical protein
MELRKRAQIEVVRGQVRGRLAAGALDLGLAQLGFDRTGDIGRDLILQLKNVVERAVEAVGPHVRAGRRVDQLPGDAHPLACFSYRAFEHVAYTQFARHLLHVDGLALVGEARIARDHKQPGQPGNRRRDLLDHAVGEIFLPGVAGHILERQYRQ